MSSSPSKYDLPFPLPVITLLDSSLYSAIFTSVYVGSLYLSKASRIAPSNKDKKEAAISRDHPEVIKARLKLVIGATVGCVFGVWGLMQYSKDVYTGVEKVGAFPSLSTLYPTFSLLGFPRSLVPHLVAPLAELMAYGPWEMVWHAVMDQPSPIAPFLLAPLLFAGPIYSDWILDQPSVQSMWKALWNWQGIRNWVVAPLTEEIVFRSCMIACAQLAGASVRHQIFITPLWFGLAHVHHAYDVFASNGKTKQAFKTAFFTCLFQFTYTTLFGWFAAHLFVKTGTLAPSLTAHVFCNIFGLPQPFAAMERHPTKKADIFVMYLLGIGGFAWAMYIGW
ncbi:hypothetical protein BDY24DRAFT_406116 [Mrakia frigida]|uniref:CAAX prenyl protease n=1 Tax=Mrakia frigida TaxID=29902 RepID=UPI003FCC1669